MLSFIFQESGRCEYTFLKFGNEGAYFFMKVEATRKLLRQLLSKLNKGSLLEWAGESLQNLSLLRTLWLTTSMRLGFAN